MGDIPSLNAEFFARNRSRLRDAFGGTAPIVITANSLLQRSADTPYDFVQDSNFWYLTGISEPGFILVLDRGSEYLIAPERDEVREAFDGAFNLEDARNRSGISEIVNSKDGWAALAKRLKRVKHVATLQPPASYIESLDMFVNPSRARLVSRILEINSELELIDLRSQFNALRMVKTSEEITAIRTAIKETYALLQLVEKKRSKAEYEYEILADLQRYLTRNQIGFAYEPIIASGENAVTLHYTKNNSKIDHANLLLLDIGARVGGYAADITRTVVSNPTKRQQAIYDTVLSVHNFACSMLKPGIDIKTYEQAVHHFMGEKLRELGLIRTISETTVREFYPHSTSHFLGIDVHDAADYSRPLAPGMVITVEPGIYIPKEGIGIRLEDNILITEDGNENLSEYIPKDLTSLTVK